MAQLENFRLRVFRAVAEHLNLGLLHSSQRAANAKLIVTGGSSLNHQRDASKEKVACKTFTVMIGLRLSHSRQGRNRLLQIASAILALPCTWPRGCGPSRYLDAIYSYLRATIGS